MVLSYIGRLLIDFVNRTFSIPGLSSSYPSFRRPVRGGYSHPTRRRDLNMPLHHLVPTDARVRPTQINTSARGRPQARRTSAHRVSQNRRGQKLIHRKPLTPTTNTAMLKERAHKRNEKKRAKEAAIEKILQNPSTYWRVLRDGKKYRSFGGTRAR